MKYLRLELFDFMGLSNYNYGSLILLNCILVKSNCFMGRLGQFLLQDLLFLVTMGLSCLLRIEGLDFDLNSLLF